MCLDVDEDGSVEEIRDKGRQADFIQSIQVPESTPSRFEPMKFFKKTTREISADGKHWREITDAGVVGGGKVPQQKLQSVKEMLKAHLAFIESIKSEMSQKRKQKKKEMIRVEWNQKVAERFNRECSHMKNWTDYEAPPSGLVMSIISGYMCVAERDQKFRFDGEKGDWTYNSLMGWWLDITVRFPTVRGGTLLVRFRVLPDISLTLGAEGGFIVEEYEILSVPDGHYIEADRNSIHLRLYQKRKREKVPKDIFLAMVQTAVKRSRDEEATRTPVVAPPATRSRSVGGGGAAAAPASAPRTETEKSSFFSTPTTRPETPPLVRANRSAGDTSFGSAEKTNKRKKKLAETKQKLANMTEIAKRQHKDAEVVEFWDESAHKRKSRGNKK